MPEPVGPKIPTVCPGATAKEMRRFNSETVPLARLYKRAFKSSEKFEIEIEIAHFGEKPIDDAEPFWKIVDAQGKVIVNGKMPEKSIPIGKNIALGKVATDLAKLVISSRREPICWP